jgi:hypothetical protein
MDKKCKQILKDNPYISYVGISDTTGKILYNGDQALIGTRFTDDVMKKSMAATEPYTQLYRRFDGYD